MNDNNNQNKNYVTPEKVDLTKVEINQENKGALNRERDNIISASIQANQAIDEKSAAVVNNTIKVKKRNPFVSLLIGLFFISIAGILAYFGFRLLEDYIKKDDAKYTTTTTTTKEVNFFENYTYDETKLRKYQNENSILILFPKMAFNNYRYIYTEKDESGVIKYEEGTYNIQNKTIKLVSSEATSNTFNIGESSLEYGEQQLSMYDQELKYYIKQNQEIESILIINGTVDNSFAYYYELDNHFFSEFTESLTDITLNNGVIFNKSGNTLNYNENVYEQVQ